MNDSNSSGKSPLPALGIAVVVLLMLMVVSVASQGSSMTRVLIMLVGLAYVLRAYYRKLINPSYPARLLPAIFRQAARRTSDKSPTVLGAELDPTALGDARDLKAWTHRYGRPWADLSEAERGARKWQLALTLTGIVAFAFGLLLLNAYFVDATTRPAAVRYGGSLIDTGVERANVRVEGDGPPIILIHGFGASIAWWDAIRPTLAAHYRVIRLDLIGHGGTAAPASGYSIKRQAQLVAAALDELDVGRVTVIAHSMGGEVAVALAEKNPERIERMVLIDSPPVVDTHFSFWTQAFLTPLVGEMLLLFRTDKSIRHELEQGFAPGYAIPTQYVDDLKQLTYTAFRSAHNGSIAYRTQKPPYQRLAALEPVPPVLGIFGSLDAIVPAETAKLFEQVPGAKVVLLDGVGHSPMVEAPAETAALIEAFLKK